MSVGLSIVFTGLCALIGDAGQRGEVLLVDASGVGEVDGVVLPEHAPTLVVSLNDLANPESSAPTRVVSGARGQAGRVEQLGLWDLSGSDVRIRVPGGISGGLQFFRPPAGATSWPRPPVNAHDPEGWRDVRFVPNMASLVGDARIHPSLLADDDFTVKPLPRAVAARVHLEGGLIEAAMPSQHNYRDDVFEFRSHGSDRSVRQAVTDTMQWTLRTEAAAVVVDIIPADGGQVKHLLLGPSALPHRLFISNLPAENPVHAGAHGALSGDRMAALHFGAYYRLLLNEPAERPLPMPWHASAARKAVGFIRPAHCSPAVFSRP